MIALDTYRKTPIGGVMRTELFAITNRFGIKKIQEKMHELIKYFPIDKNIKLAEWKYKRVMEENRSKELDIRYNNQLLKYENKAIKLKKWKQIQATNKTTELNIQHGKQLLKNEREIMQDKNIAIKLKTKYDDIMNNRKNW
jgi:hypothetical protein